MKKYISISLLALAVVGCSPLQKALKSEDVEFKKEVAQNLYDQKKYKKAVRLYEQLDAVSRARPEAEQMYFNFANSYYMMKQYPLSAERFKLFAATYARSEKQEEALLLEIKSNYNLSPVYSLDQSYTDLTIRKLQDFIDKYPTSEFAIEANQIMTKLNEKLERKAFESAKQLNTIGGWTRDYNAAIVALDNFIFDYPGTHLKEEALYYKFDSAYHLAVNSVYSKMQDRLLDAKTMYESLIRFNPETKYKEDADRMLAEINSELQQFSK